MAAFAFSKLSATISAIGCPKKRTLLSYKTLCPLHSATFLGRSAALVLYPGTAGQFAKYNTSNTPVILSAALVSIFLIVPLAILLVTKTA